MKDNQKRILILGATPHSIHVIDAARKLGIYTIVTDYVKNSPAKAYADKAYDVSTLDVDALIELCKNEQVDGLIAGYVDINLSPYYQVCKAMGYPYYCDDRQIDMTMNKKHFKDLCRRHGIAVAADIDEKLIEGAPDKIKYPVIVKPADSYSSKGISVVHDAESLKPAIDKAYSFSKCHEVVVEEFIKADDVYLYFTVQNGYVSISAMADRLLNDKQYGSAPQPVGYFFPSRYLDLYLEKVHKKVQEMIAEVGLKNGSFFLQGFATGDDIVFFEMGLRLSGGCGYLQIRHQNEIDQVAMYVNYAVSGKFGPWDLKKYDNPRFKDPACVVVVLLGKGVVTKIIGLDAVKNDPSFFDIIQLKKENDELTEIGTLNQVFARIYFSNKDKNKLNESIENIRKNLKILDENGKNMILNLFDEEEVE